MGNKILEPTTNESQERYRLILYPGSQLPQEYINLIKGPFKTSLRYGNDLYKLIDSDAYYKAYDKYIDLLLQRPLTQVKVAILNDDTIIGWRISENKTLHYLWVKKEVRRQGIGKELMPTEFDTITHITNKGINIWVNHYPNVKFNPFA
jgi:GNAT superfamily N-acetyltransferase